MPAPIIHISLTLFPTTLLTTHPYPCRTLPPHHPPSGPPSSMVAPIRGLRMEMEACTQADVGEAVARIQMSMQLPRCSDATVEDAISGRRVLMCAAGTACVDEGVLVVALDAADASSPAAAVPEARRPPRAAASP